MPAVPWVLEPSAERLRRHERVRPSSERGLPRVAAGYWERPPRALRGRSTVNLSIQLARVNHLHIRVVDAPSSS